MIRVDFVEPQTPDWLDWRMQCSTEQEKHNTERQSGRESKASSRLYKGKQYNIKATVYTSVDGPFHGKCAYCEQKIHGDQYEDIEHFRPKDGVTDEDGKVVQVEINGEMKEHPGYYWLCYDWRNLLPSCVRCNRLSSDGTDGRKIGKHTRFPVKGFRAVRPGEEVHEEPLLINPVVEDPSEHLALESNGVYTWKSERGRACIEILGLNVRDLPNERRATYNEVLLRMGALAQSMIINPNSQETRNFMDDILAHKNGHQPFTAASRKAIVDASARQDILRNSIRDD